MFGNNVAVLKTNAMILVSLVLYQMKQLQQWQQWKIKCLFALHAQQTNTPPIHVAGNLAWLAGKRSNKSIEWSFVFSSKNRKKNKLHTPMQVFVLIVYVRLYEQKSHQHFKNSTQCNSCEASSFFIFDCMLFVRRTLLRFTTAACCWCCPFTTAFASEQTECVCSFSVTNKRKQLLTIFALNVYTHIWSSHMQLCSAVLESRCENCLALECVCMRALAPIEAKKTQCIAVILCKTGHIYMVLLHKQSNRLQ